MNNSIKIKSIKNNCKAIISVPSSKSISNRLLMIRAMSNNYFQINNLSECDDTKILDGFLNSSTNIFDAKNAGTAFRFFTAFASTIVGQWTITGCERMKERPIGPLVDALRELGAEIEYLGAEGFPPLKIIGIKLKKCDLIIKGDTSSQFISAILLIAPRIQDGLQITIEGKIVSAPYINMTLKLMNYFGVKTYCNKNTIKIPPQDYEGKPITVESDWSSVVPWFGIVAISENIEIEIPGLIKNSLQGDKILIDIFEKLGVKTIFNSKGILLKKINKPKLNFFEFDFSSYPDISMSIIVCLSILQIPFRLTGLKSLAIKESNRLNAVKDELLKTGICVEILNESEMICENFNFIDINKTIKFCSYNDHRIVMAFALFATKYEEIKFDNMDCVNKSYPDFWSMLLKIIE